MLCLAFGIAWMAGLTPWHDELRPDTPSSALIFPFLVAGTGIGLATAPITTVVMAAAPRDRVGNASGVLSTMRQVGSLLGIASLGAVMQNRVTANIVNGIRAIPGMPQAAKDKVVAGLSEGGMQMGAALGGPDVPPDAAGLVARFFKEWFTQAINTAFLVGAAFAVTGGLCALLLRWRDAHDGAAEVAGASGEPSQEAKAGVVPADDG